VEFAVRLEARRLDVDDAIGAFSTHGGREKELRWRRE